MYPRVIVNREKLFKNTQIIVDEAKRHQVDVFAVTKVFCGHPDIAQICLDAGVKGLADSRIGNLKKLFGLPCDKMLLRLPMLCEVEDVIRFSDISLNSELETIRALDMEASKQHKTHKIILMIDLGDLREGILPEDVHVVVPGILACKHIALAGVGVNLTCYGGVIPDEVNLGQLDALAKDIEATYGLPLTYVSGGNSSSIYLLQEDRLPRGIHQLRVGEAIVLGRETAFGHTIKGTYDDAFLLEAQVIEIKHKQSLPIGNIGMDAFGNKPIFEDRGMMRRAIVGIGRQDVDHLGLTPLNEGVEIIGASSDHMILNVTQADAGTTLGHIMTFKMDYSAMLKLFTSEYVNKVVMFDE